MADDTPNAGRTLAYTVTVHGTQYLAGTVPPPEVAAHITNPVAWEPEAEQPGPEPEPPAGAEGSPAGDNPPADGPHQPAVGGEQKAPTRRSTPKRSAS